MILTVGSRDSQLAREQSEYVIDLLEDHTDVRAELRTVDSLGDQKQDVDPGDLNEIGIFTSKLDRELAEGTFDLVVHSLKDCPTERENDLELAAVPPRATPFDVLVGQTESIPDLEDGTVIGTSSRRRRANLLFHNENLTVEPCRGNVPTRIDKLNAENEEEDPAFDALVLAAAGIERLDLTPKSRLLRRNEMIPAAGQGALAVFCRSADDKIKDRLRTINHESSAIVTRCERSFLATLEGGCEAPIGALGRLSNEELHLTGSVTEPEGTRQIFDTIEGSPENPAELGTRLAEEFLDRGAAGFLER
jgi:hydroxymethylbilane synthase